MKYSLEVQLVVVLYHPSDWTRVRSWFTHVHVDEAAQGKENHWEINSHNANTRNQRKVMIPASVVPDDSKMILEENSFHSTVVK